VSVVDKCLQRNLNGIQEKTKTNKTTISSLADLPNNHCYKIANKNIHDTLCSSARCHIIYDSVGDHSYPETSVFSRMDPLQASDVFLPGSSEAHATAYKIKKHTNYCNLVVFVENLD